MTAAVASLNPAVEETQLAKKAKLDQMICWWSIIIFYQMFGLIFGYLTKIMQPPLPGPNLALEKVLSFTVGNAAHMQLGMTLLAIALGFASMTTGLIVVQMKRMSGPGPVLAYGYLACGALAALPGCFFCALLFSTAVFRPDRDPQIIAMLYEAGYIGFVGCLGSFGTQYVVFALAIFLDKRNIFPKWLAYMSIWNLVTELVAAPVWIFKSGPYAWNGLISFYLGTIIFVVWITCVIVYLKKAINKQTLEEVNPVYMNRLRAQSVAGA